VKDEFGLKVSIEYSISCESELCFGQSRLLVIREYHCYIRWYQTVKTAVAEHNTDRSRHRVSLNTINILDNKSRARKGRERDSERDPPLQYEVRELNLSEQIMEASYPVPGVKLEFALRGEASYT
jgi:hypothetical protein